MPIDTKTDSGPVMYGVGRPPIRPDAQSIATLISERSKFIPRGRGLEDQLGASMHALFDCSTSVVKDFIDEYGVLLHEFKESGFKEETADKVMFSQELARFFYRGLRYPNEFPHIENATNYLKTLSNQLGKTEYAALLGDKMYLAIAGARAHAGLMYALESKGYTIVLPDIKDKKECDLWDRQVGCDFVAYKDGKLFFIDAKIDLKDTQFDGVNLRETPEVSHNRKYMNDGTWLKVDAIRRNVISLLKIPDVAKAHQVYVKVPSVGIEEDSIGRFHPEITNDIVRQLNLFK